MIRICPACETRWTAREPVPGLVNTADLACPHGCVADSVMECLYCNAPATDDGLCEDCWRAVFPNEYAESCESARVSLTGQRNG